MKSKKADLEETLKKYKANKEHFDVQIINAPTLHGSACKEDLEKLTYDSGLIEMNQNFPEQFGKTSTIN